MRSPKEPKRLEKITQISEEEKSKLILLISKARSLFIDRRTKAEELKNLLDEIKPYADMRKTNGYYLFPIIDYHYERLRKEYRAKTGFRYK